MTNGGQPAASLAKDRALLLTSAAALAIGVFVGWQLRALGTAANTAEDLDALARAQVERFYAGTAGRAPLAEMLGEGFQFIRTDGTRYDPGPGYATHRSSILLQQVIAWFIDVTQIELAQMVNLSRNAVGKILRKLGEDGHLTWSYGQIRIIDPEALLLFLAADDAE